MLGKVLIALHLLMDKLVQENLILFSENKVKTENVEIQVSFRWQLTRFLRE